MNKDKPESGCNGKCHLSKQLQEADETEKQKQPTNRKDNKTITLFYDDSHFPILKKQEDRNIKEVQILRPLLSSGFLTEVFHPPKMKLT